MEGVARDGLVDVLEDVVDEIAAKTPDKRALVWCNDKGDQRTFSFGEIKRSTDKTANFLISLGIQKGDPVMLILKRHFEYWFCLLALHKIGAIAIPATHLLKAKDIIYRNNAASIKMIVCVDETEILDQIDIAAKESSTLAHKVVIGKDRPGWQSFYQGMETASEHISRPTGRHATRNEDISLLYFTSGTTGMPKGILLSNRNA